MTTRAVFALMMAAAPAGCGHGTSSATKRGATTLAASGTESSTGGVSSTTPANTGATTGPDGRL